MILGLEDIAGGTPLVSFLIWLALSGLLYLVTYVATLNWLDDLTRNSFMKIPAMLGAAIPSAMLMAVFQYKPFALGALICIANYFRVREKISIIPEKWGDIKPNATLFYGASYAYIFLLIALALYIPGLAQTAAERGAG